MREPKGKLRAASSLLLVAWMWISAPAWGQDDWWSITIPRLNTTYSHPDTDLGPQKVGPLTLHLSSPDNELEVVQHRARLKPLPDATHRVKLRVRFQGRGALLALLESGDKPTRFEDEIKLPPQEVNAQGRIGFRRTQAGILLTLHELPSTVAVRFESRLGEQVTALCEQLAVLFLGAADCSAIEGLFREAHIPLPDPGTSYLLTPEVVGLEGMRLLELYLTRKVEIQEGSIE